MATNDDTSNQRRFSDVRLEAVQVGETHRTLNSDYTVTTQDLPGEVYVYLVIDGGRILFDRINAGKVLDAIELAGKQQQTQPAQAQQAAPTQGQPAQVQQAQQPETATPPTDGGQQQPQQPETPPPGGEQQQPQ